MAFTTIVYKNTASKTSLGRIEPIEDQHVRKVSNGYRIPALNNLFGVFGLGRGFRRIQLRSPSLRELWYEEILDFVAGDYWPKFDYIDEGGSSKHHVAGEFPSSGYMDNPLPLVEGEVLECWIVNDGTNKDQDVFVLLSDGPRAPYSGEIRTVRATTETITSTREWEYSELTFDQELPSGRYALVGAMAESTYSGWIRFVPVGERWRPGCPVYKYPLVGYPREFRRGYIGTWLEFDYDTPPGVEAYLRGSGSINLLLDLVRL